MKNTNSNTSEDKKKQTANENKIEFPVMVTTTGGGGMDFRPQGAIVQLNTKSVDS